jgi:uncharacterized protein YdhG (YjbR/CyaY superfamily)
VKGKIMEDNKITFKSIDEYILKFPNEIQKILDKLRTVIKDSAPDAQEKISYQMPTFALHGNLVYFAVWKNHIGFYPTSSVTEVFKNELSEYQVSKGTIRFSLQKPLPYELISKIVKYRVAENIKRAEDKLKKTKTK